MSMDNIYKSDQYLSTIAALGAMSELDREQLASRMMGPLRRISSTRCPACAGTGVSLRSSLDCTSCGATGSKDGYEPVLRGEARMLIDALCDGLVGAAE